MNKNYNHNDNDGGDWEDNTKDVVVSGIQRSVAHAISSLQARPLSQVGADNDDSNDNDTNNINSNNNNTKITVK
jgi:hypothetical protein